MLEMLSDSGVTMAYLERALGLPARTAERWKAGESSAAALALLRTITSFPWILEVADGGFERQATDAAILVQSRKGVSQ